MSKSNRQFQSQSKPWKLVQKSPAELWISLRTNPSPLTCVLLFHLCSLGLMVPKSNILESKIKVPRFHRPKEKRRKLKTKHHYSVQYVDQTIPKKCSRQKEYEHYMIFKIMVNQNESNHECHMCSDLPWYPQVVCPKPSANSREPPIASMPRHHCSQVLRGLWLWAGLISSRHYWMVRSHWGVKGVFMWFIFCTGIRIKDYDNSWYRLSSQSSFSKWFCFCSNDITYFVLGEFLMVLVWKCFGQVSQIGSKIILTQAHQDPLESNHLKNVFFSPKNAKVHTLGSWMWSARACDD